MSENFCAENQHTLFLGSIRSDASEEGIVGHFARFGGIRRAKIIFDVVTLKSKQCALLFCEDEATCKRILAHPEHVMGGKKIRVTPADSNKKGTKKIHTSLVLVENSSDALSLDRILSYFCSFGSVEGYEVLSAYSFMSPQSIIIRYSDTEAVSAATKNFGIHHIDGQLVETAAFDGKDLGESCQISPKARLSESEVRNSYLQQNRMQPLGNNCQAFYNLEINDDRNWMASQSQSQSIGTSESSLSSSFSREDLAEKGMRRVGSYSTQENDNSPPACKKQAALLYAIEYETDPLFRSFYGLSEACKSARSIVPQRTPGKTITIDDFLD